MPLLSSVLVAATFVAGGLSTAIPPRISTAAGPGNFSVSQVRNPHFVKHGPIALAKAYLKYGVPVPEALAAAISKRSTGSAVTTPEQFDSEYLTPVSIGTPAQLLNLDFDTGSSDLWVFSTETPRSEVDGQTRYNPSKSSTAKKLSGATWSIEYADGSSSSGDVYTDTVTVGGLTVSKQAVESAQQVSSQFVQDSDSDGLLGLAFSSINTVSPTPQKTFFDNAKSSLNSPVFTADLKHNAPGHYNFGFIDSSAFTGSLTYTPVDNSQGFWGFTSSGYAVGSASFSSTSIQGIADTGTTLLLLPTAIANAYYKKVSGAQFEQDNWVFPCSTTNLPSFTFGVGSARFTIPGSFMNFAPADDSGELCFGGIQDNSGIPFSIFGDIALKATFVVFDGGANRLGWASKSL